MYSFSILKCPYILLIVGRKEIFHVRVHIYVYMYGATNMQNSVLNIEKGKILTIFCVCTVVYVDHSMPKF